MIIVDICGVLPRITARDLPKVDVVILCGSIAGQIQWHKLKEQEPPASQYKRVFDMLRNIQAPLKIVVPGGYDLSLDPKLWQRLVCFLLLCAVLGRQILTFHRLF